MLYLYKYTVSVLIIHSLKRFNSYYHRQWLRTIAQQFTYKNDTEWTEENKKREWVAEWIKSNSIMPRIRYEESIKQKTEVSYATKTILTMKNNIFLNSMSNCLLLLCEFEAGTHSSFVPVLTFYIVTYISSL